MIIISTEATKARTPPSMLGGDRKIVVANKRYHLGCLGTEVTIGFAGIKFSGSPRSQGP